MTIIILLHVWTQNTGNLQKGHPFRRSYVFFELMVKKTVEKIFFKITFLTVRPIKSIWTFTDVPFIAKPSVSASSWTLRFIKYNDNLNWILHTLVVSQLLVGSIYPFDTTVKIFAYRQANAGRNGSSAKTSSREISFFFVSPQIEVSSRVQTNARCAC